MGWYAVTEQKAVSEFIPDGYFLATLARFVYQACACKGNFYFLAVNCTTTRENAEFHV